MRVFIGVNIPREMKAELKAIQKKSAIKADWSDAENYHITLKFIGEADKNEILRIKNAMKVCRGFGKQHISLDKLGTFGKEEKIIWCGINGAKGLSELSHIIGEALKAEGISFDAKPFKAHITLARRARDFCEAGVKPVEGVINEVILFESKRINGVLRYIPLHTQEL